VSTLCTLAVIGLLVSIVPTVRARAKARSTAGV
jgi:hypothetical protein